MERGAKLAGSRIGRLLVICDIGRYSNGAVKWKCMCDCGNEVERSTSSLLSRGVKSCGCYAREYTTLRNSTHGNCKHPLWSTYCNMMKRVYSKTAKSYKNYGGRGIAVCDEWRNSFAVFASDIGSKPSSKHQLDRIDNDKGYSKDNCRWATKEVNCQNTRPRAGSSKFKGVTYNKNRKRYIARCANRHLGYFKEEIAAAIEYDKAAELLYGDSAWLNRNHFDEVLTAYS